MLQKKKDNKSINQINFMAILFAGLFAFLSACLVIVNEYLDFQKEIKVVEESYIQMQQKSASTQLSLLQNIAEYRYSQSKNLPKEKIYKKLKEDITALMANMEAQNYVFLKRSSGEIIYRSAVLNHEDTSKDIIVTQLYEPLDLLLGSGVSTHSIEDVLAQKKKAYEDKIINFVLKIYMLTLFLYLVSTVEYRYVSDIMKREIRFIVYSFKKASQSYEFIDMEKIKFQEFQEIVTHANVMIEEIKSKNSALVDLNSNLEGIVEQKTIELKRSVDFTQELLEKQDRFVKNAIHEINTPLSIILMNIDLYNLKFDKNPYLIKIEAAVKVLDNIYEDLAYVVKKDRVVYEKSMIDFSKFITERVEYFEDVAEGNKLHIVTDIAPDLFIVFNEIELQRICDNNLSNAIKYSYEKQPLHVRLYAEEESVVLEVQNCGEMIQAPWKVFGRYYREDEARGGFGLGLNIVKEICDSNDVSIDVLSDESRTLFAYRFPKG
ncbi:sensor histidine kinase [Sulfurospirillum oryzae]|uniref:sensor histidine kinase n=1 Tax=Sulfurospirillum oryzae TaxID=2976535 RepID=UPI0021E829D2|nr:HAMP domain-containing sensor histidine kinase [Sulfurospirillum oryzae]